MAFRRPLVNSNGNLREMNDTEIQQVQARAAHLYRRSPSVYIGVYSGGGGNMGTTYDTRMVPGAGSTSTTAYPPETTTAEPYSVSVAYNRTLQTVSSVSLTSDNGTRYPAYYDGGNIRAMSLTDMYDTFIKQAIQYSYQMYRISATYDISIYSGTSEWQRVSNTPVFEDRRADTAAYSKDYIPYDQDRSKLLTSWYLHRDYPSVQAINFPFSIDGNANIKQYAASSFDSILLELTRYAAVHLPGYRIRYNWSTDSSASAGANLSSTSDTRLNGSGNYQTRFVNGDDYRAQEFPNGVPILVNSYYLKGKLV
jgi:hypothetical protein